MESYSSDTYLFRCVRAYQMTILRNSAIHSYYSALRPFPDNWFTAYVASKAGQKRLAMMRICDLSFDIKVAAKILINSPFKLRFLYCFIIIIIKTQGFYY